MTLLDQCKIWNENDEYQKIIEALEAVPAQERTPEMDSRTGPGLQQPGRAGGPGAVPQGHCPAEAP